MSNNNKQIPIQVREIIIKLRNEKKSLQEIANIVGTSRSTVQTILKNYSESGSLLPKSRTGRPKKLSNVEERNIIRKVKLQPRITAQNIVKDIALTTGKSVHRTTVSRLIKKHGYNSRVARRTPFISSKNQKRRLEFAKTHLRFGNDFWRKVIFSDESKFNICGNDGRVRVWRKANTEMEKRNTVATFKHGKGNVMVWGCMSEAGVGNLVFIENIMDRFGYLNILKNNLWDSARKMGLGDGFIFQQDNDPKHNSRIVQEWISKNTEQKLDHPPQSPDLNPIEHLWDELKRRIRNHQITSKENLKNILQTEWARIQPEITKKLVLSMPRRLEEVIRFHGNGTSY